MKLEIEIEDEKAGFILELLSHFEFVKTKAVNGQQTNLKEGILQAIEEVNLHKQGKITLKTARQILDEL